MRMKKNIKDIREYQKRKKEIERDKTIILENFAEIKTYDFHQMKIKNKLNTNITSREVAKIANIRLLESLGRMGKRDKIELFDRKKLFDKYYTEVNEFEALAYGDVAYILDKKNSEAYALYKGKILDKKKLENQGLKEYSFNYQEKLKENNI